MPFTFTLLFPWLDQPGSNQSPAYAVLIHSFFFLRYAPFPMFECIIVDWQHSKCVVIGGVERSTRWKSESSADFIC